MKNFMLDHAIRNVWCSPFQDDQAILALNRITSIGRAVNHFEYQNRRMPLPETGTEYHVYVIGQNSHQRLNLVEQIGVWKSFAEQAGDNYLYSDIYLDSGLQLSRSLCKVYRGNDLNYFVAIPMHDKVADLDYQTVYLRLYRNSYFTSDRDTSGTDKVLVGGGLIRDKVEALQYQREYLDALAKPEGHAYAFLNGYMVDNFLPNEVTEGDTIEWVYDASIAEVVEFKISDLEHFTSSMDELMKYVIHPPKKADEQIEYHDDVDFWIVRKRPDNPDRWKAIYFNKNSQKSVRMLTHRDYSIPTTSVAAVIGNRPDWVIGEDVYIRIHIRKSGYARPLVDEHNRIHELYKLTDEEIVRAMVGVDATVQEWQVNNLESSTYTRIMRSFYQDVTVEEVIQAYGYNAMAKLVADTPNKLTGLSLDVPVAFRQNSTAFEFDTNGLLTGWRRHPGGDVYYPMSQTTTMVEFIDGIGSEDSDFKFSNEGTVTLDPMEEYRFYACRIGHDGQPSNEWADVTGDRNFYHVDRGVVVWVFDTQMWLGAVKGNSHFTCFDLTIAEYNHMYRFELLRTDDPGDILTVPPARIDIWMNKKALIEHIDYHVNFPEIVIFNKSHLKEGEQKFTIRGYGLPSADLGRDLSTQRGYVQHGMVSVNNVYDIREDKVIRCVIDGRVFHRSAIKFAETQRNIVAPGIKDGSPYLIQDAISPIRGLVDYSTYPLRQQSLDVDHRVSDYLSLKLPEQTPDEPVTIENYYAIFSPFLARVMYDLWAEFIPSLAPETPEETVHKLMEPYLWLLDFDPCRKDYVDSNFVNIHPHPKNSVLGVTKAQYGFLERLNELYLNGRVDLTPFLAITSEGEDGGIVDPPVIPDPEPIPPPVYPWYVRSDDNLEVALPTATDVVMEVLRTPEVGIVLSEPRVNPDELNDIVLSDPKV